MATKEATKGNTKSAKELEEVPENGKTPGAKKEEGAGSYLPKNEEIIVPDKTITEHWKREPERPVSIPMVSENEESEEQFLHRLLSFQHTGGWGRHLDSMIYGRLKVINPEGKEGEENPKDWYE